VSLIQSRQLLGKLTHREVASNTTRTLNFLCVAYQLLCITLLINPASPDNTGTHATRVPSPYTGFHINSLILISKDVTHLWNVNSYIYIYIYTVCLTRYRTGHFFNNFTTNEDIATKFEADLPHCVRNVTTS